MNASPAGAPLSLAILTRGEEIHSTQRLSSTARDHGHRAVVVPILETSVVFTAGAGGASASELWGLEGPIPSPDGVFPRLGTFMPQLGLAALRHWERQGVPSLNSSTAIETSQDKLRTLEKLSRRGIPVPESTFVKDLRALSRAVRSVGGAPVIIKPLRGNQGRGVILAESEASAISILEALLYQNQDLLVQEFLPEARREELRLVVLGGRVVAAARRTSRPGEFRGNFHQGGALEEVDVPDEISRVAVEATEVVGLELAGIDLVVTASGPRVLEVNSSPGLEGIEAACGVDLAERMLQDLLARVSVRT